MRYMSSALAVALGAAAFGLVRYAAGDDGYYGSGVSRWEHAERWGKTPVVAAAIAVSVATAAGLLASIFSTSALLRRISLLGSALSGVLLALGWFYLTAGH
jgi:ABC-type Fe3+ transport system permease subunit